MKFLLFSNYGPAAPTEGMKSILNKGEFPKNRTGEIIEYIENHSVVLDFTHHYNEKEIADYMRNLERGIFEIVKVKEKDDKSITYHVYDKENKVLSNFSIVDLDTDKHWTLKEYDGKEYIEYLEYEVIDKEMNYCQFNN